MNKLIYKYLKARRGKYYTLNTMRISLGILVCYYVQISQFYFKGHILAIVDVFIEISGLTVFSQTFVDSIRALESSVLLHCTCSLILLR